MKNGYSVQKPDTRFLLSYCIVFFVFLRKKITPRCICREPANGDGTPDCDNTQWCMRCQRIGQCNPRSKRNDREDQRNVRLVDSSEISIPEKQNTDSRIHGAFYPKVSCTFADDFRLACIYEELHQISGEDKNQNRNDQAETGRGQKPNACSFSDSICLFCSVVLGDKQRVRISKLLRRHISDCVDFHGSSEAGHDCCAEAVDQSLNHQNAEVHDGLLDACCHIIHNNLP